MADEVRRRVDHAKNFHELLHPIETSQMNPQCREHRECHLTSGRIAIVLTDFRAHSPRQQRAVQRERTVPGDVADVSNLNDRRVVSAGLWCFRQFQSKFHDACFGAHKLVS